jgi:hypothetical protein
MREFQINGALLDRLKVCITKTFAGEVELDLFTAIREDRLGLKFAAMVAGGVVTFEQIVFKYCEQLNLRSRAVLLFDLLWEEKPGFRQLPEAAALAHLLEHLAPPATDQPPVYDCKLVRAENMPFIDRQELKEKVGKLLHGSIRQCLLINGESGVGLTYTRLYLSEVAALTGSFTVVDVNLKKLSRRIDGQIQLVHVAQHLVRTIPGFSVDYDLSDPEQFKYDIFYRDFQDFLANADQPYFFFFDQFEVPYAEDVFYFLTELVETLLDGLLIKNAYLFLAGFRDVQEWDYEVRMSLDSVRLEPFTRDQVEAFIGDLYDWLDEKYDLAFAKSELLATLRQNESFLADELYEADRPTPNVTEVGRGVTEWFRALRQQIESA